ncbi:hypothetical protein BC832DRAFT_565901 [Gaertneriomyces semiglobifer]|nr:hypothetical protein BC832DRAFT_565901 [Gaertneriomyces semiglobifer]
MILLVGRMETGEITGKVTVTVVVVVANSVVVVTSVDVATSVVVKSVDVAKSVVVTSSVVVGVGASSSRSNHFAHFFFHQSSSRRARTGVGVMDGIKVGIAGRGAMVTGMMSPSAVAVAVQTAVMAALGDGESWRFLRGKTSAGVGRRSQ